MELGLAGLESVELSATRLFVVPVLSAGDDIHTPDLPGALQPWLADRLDALDLKAELGRSRVAYPGVPGGPGCVVFLGIGDPREVTREIVRRFVGHAVREAETLEAEALWIYLPSLDAVDEEAVGQAAAEGAVLAAWRFDELFSEEGSIASGDRGSDVSAVTLVVDSEVVDRYQPGFRVGEIVGRAQNLARSLQERPGNVATPSHLAETATRLGEQHGFAVKVLGPAAMREEGMNALLAVARGSDQEPRLIVLEHRGGPSGSPPLALVGKGLTFDAGGISIKPAKGMEEMKFDMSGGAAVIGAMQAVAELELPVNVLGIVPSSENLLGGSALKPGDVIRTRSGKTVEVTNTDAEGRLILSDALDYARSFDPTAIVDCATLTGSVVIALGHHAAAVLGTDDELVAEVRDAGERAGERCWPLPLWDEYRKQLKSEVADLNNVGGRPAGTITAACFLSEFVGDLPWAHLDIAGTAYGSEPLPYQRKGGFGLPTRLLVEWVRGRAG